MDWPFPRFRIQDNEGRHYNATFHVLRTQGIAQEVIVHAGIVSPDGQTPEKLYDAAYGAPPAHQSRHGSGIRRSENEKRINPGGASEKMIRFGKRSDMFRYFTKFFLPIAQDNQLLKHDYPIYLIRIYPNYLICILTPVLVVLNMRDMMS